MTQIFLKVLPYYRQLESVTRHNLRIDALTALIFGLFAGTVYPFVAIIAVRLGASDLLIGFLTTASYFGNMFAIYWGHRSAQKERKVPMVFGAWLISRMLIIPLAFVTSPLVFVTLVIFHQLISNIGTPAYNSLLKKIYPDGYRGRIMGLVKLCLGITHVSATYIAGIWIDVWGFKSLFLIAGILGVISALTFTQVNEGIKENSGKQPLAPFSLKKISEIFKKDKALFWCILGFTIFGFGNLFAFPAYPIFQVKVLGLTNSQIALISVFNFPVWFLTYPFWGWLHDRTRSMINIYIGIILYGLAPLIYLIYPSFWMLILASCVQGAGGASQDVGYINQMIKMGGAEADHYMGIYGTFLGIRGILAPVLGSLMISQIGFQGVFIITIILIFTGLIPMSKVEQNGKKFFDYL